MTDQAVIRVDLSEVDAALDLLVERCMDATGAELHRLWLGCHGIHASDPEWISQEFHGGALHVVPGPKLLELLAPMAGIREVIGR